MCPIGKNDGSLDFNWRVISSSLFDNGFGSVFAGNRRSEFYANRRNPEVGLEALFESVYPGLLKYMIKRARQ
jgi:hypothetical protein